MRDVPIGKLAKLTGVKVPTIRYYEEVGIMPSPARTESNRRLYGADAVRRLRFVKHARELGFETEAIRQLLALQNDPHQSCARADTLARAHLGEVERRLKSLRALRVELKQMLEGCSRGQVAQCRVIEVLADHGRCLHEHKDLMTSQTRAKGATRARTKRQEPKSNAPAETARWQRQRS